ncbi:hypothetical protein IWQ57_003971 [Coemansia nantahalensis]|uniref:Uncharacterized protein n=1 Tax=Coemansia nantahalensis TaxID=2789366 RepID=A0ACC1JUF6_9FUNG|nr:hypothetical protein IWQ57_003971 [Coemansia nantahalensis]
MSALVRLWNHYAERRPLLTLSLTNGAMAGAGDAIAQLLAPAQASGSQRTAQAYDPWRTARFGAFGCLFGPVAFRWYSLLDRRFPLPAKAAAWARARAIGKRVAADQVLFAPVAVASFFAVMGALEQKTPGEIGASFRDKYPAALAGNYVLWPAAQVINFGVVPLVYRVPFSGLVSVLWNTYLSLVNSRRCAEPGRACR